MKKTTFLTIAVIVCCCFPAVAENEDLRAWESQIAAGKYAGIEKKIEASKQEALSKDDLVRVSALEELEDEIKRRKAAASGTKTDNTTSLNDAVRMQMLGLQTMVEKFARQHHGKYPTTLTAEFKGYFPMITINKSNSTAPFFNPYTKKQEWFTIKPLSNVDEIDSEEVLQKGQIVYIPIKQGTSYAIISGASEGKLLRGKDGKVVVITRKEPSNDGKVPVITRKEPSNVGKVPVITRKEPSNDGKVPVITKKGSSNDKKIGAKEAPISAGNANAMVP
jgi:hypothetical protein